MLTSMLTGFVVDFALRFFLFSQSVCLIESGSYNQTSTTNVEDVGEYIFLKSTRE